MKTERMDRSIRNLRPSGQVNKNKYHLEVYLPGSARDVWMKYDSDTPFMAFHHGDIINSSIWPGSEMGKVLRVVGVEHIVWESISGLIKHKVCIYIEEIEDRAEERFIRS
jgi:hypothetical protein